MRQMLFALVLSGFGEASPDAMVRPRRPELLTLRADRRDDVEPDENNFQKSEAVTALLKYVVGFVNC